MATMTVRSAWVSTLGVGFDVRELVIDADSIFSGIQSVSHSATNATINYSEGLSDSYTGNGFGSYDSQGVPTTGTINRIDNSFMGQTLLTTADFAMSWQAYRSFVNANDTMKLLAALFTGDDTLNGTTLDDYLIGFAGNDTFIGTMGNDTFDGQSGADTADYSAATGAINIDLSISGPQNVGAGFGADTLLSIESVTGGAGDDHLNGNTSANRLIGGAGEDSLSGIGGNDTLDGGKGNDRLTGGNGDDTYYVDVVGDVIVELAGAGIDTVFSSANRTLGADLENLTQTGSKDINGTGNSLGNEMRGNSGDNNLLGAGGTDTLRGLDGNDNLNGGAHADTLYGGTGADIFTFNSALSNANIDTIVDFRKGEGDKIHLDNAVMAGLGADGALLAARFYVGSAAHDSSDRLIYNPSTGALYYDSNGNVAGGMQQIAWLDTGLNLTATDFWVI